METESLNTAAGYINNLLLARGLLRNGKPVDFCSLASDGDKKASKEARPTVTAQVINLVHDLILRRDVRTSTTAVWTLLTWPCYSATKRTSSLSLRPSPPFAPTTPVRRPSWSERESDRASCREKPTFSSSPSATRKPPPPVPRARHVSSVTRFRRPRRSFHKCGRRRITTCGSGISSCRS